jgi:hypothetical protein
MNRRCLLCPRPAVDGHHVTATDENGSYLDPGFAVGFCHDCHELAGDDLNTIGAPGSEAVGTRLDWIEVRVTRAAACVGRVAQAAPEPFAWLLLCLARFLARVAGDLRTSIDALDENAKGWRATPGV